MWNFWLLYFKQNPFDSYLEWVKLISWLTSSQFSLENCAGLEKGVIVPTLSCVEETAFGFVKLLDTVQCCLGSTPWPRGYCAWSCIGGFVKTSKEPTRPLTKVHFDKTALDLEDDALEISRRFHLAWKLTVSVKNTYSWSLLLSQISIFWVKSKDVCPRIFGFFNKVVCFRRNYI